MKDNILEASFIARMSEGEWADLSVLCAMAGITPDEFCTYACLQFVNYWEDDDVRRAGLRKISHDRKKRQPAGIQILDTAGCDDEVIEIMIHLSAFERAETANMLERWSRLYRQSAARMKRQAARLPGKKSIHELRVN